MAKELSSYNLSHITTELEFPQETCRDDEKHAHGYLENLFDIIIFHI